jgi:hypothetical protein
MVNRARSASLLTSGASGETLISPRNPGPTSAPAIRNTSAFDNTDRAASPDSATRHE